VPQVGWFNIHVTIQRTNINCFTEVISSMLPSLVLPSVLDYFHTSAR